MNRRLALVTLVVPDYDAAIAFYVGSLGFDLLSDADLGGGKRWVTVAPPGTRGGAGFLLARADGEDQSRAIGCQTGGRVAFFLETDDFARDHAAMLAQGVTFEEPPRHERYGTVAVWRDPWGNRWDLLEPATARQDHPSSTARDS